ncbi:hypothetical protein ABG067_007741 [Albugo candida]
MTLSPVSEALKLMIANPKFTNHLDCLPDRTENQSIKLAQGEKWRTHPSFQQPMIVREDGVQLWINDTVKLLNSYYQDSEHRPAFKLFGFFTKDGVIQVEAFTVTTTTVNHVTNTLEYGISDSLVTFDVSSIDRDSIVRPAPDDFTSVYHGVYDEAMGDFMPSALTERQSSMFKRPLPNNTHFPLEARSPAVHAYVDRDGVRQFFPGRVLNYMVVRLTPVNLFSDDTSGNRTKKWNKFDYWTMTPSAFAYSMRNQYASHYLLCASNKLNAGEMSKPIVDDLKLLESGMEMFSQKYSESVLVIAPVLFISADNPRHSDVSCTQMSAATYYCRYCYFRRFDNSVRTLDHIGFEQYEAERRCRDHYMHYFFPTENQTPLTVMAMNEHRVIEPVTNLGTLGYKRTGCELFLQLNSWDPSKDCPVEILHTVLLGVAKHTFDVLKKYFLTTEQLAVITSIYSNRRSKAIRTFTSNMDLQGSFVGRDYKYLIQQFPLTLYQAHDHPLFAPQRHAYLEIFQCVSKVYEKIGELASLLYMAEIDQRFDEYWVLVHNTAEELIDSVDILEHVDLPGGHSRPPRRNARTNNNGNTAGNNGRHGPNIPLSDLNNDENVEPDNNLPFSFTGPENGTNDDEVNEDVNEDDSGPSTIYRKSGGPLNNRLKFHLLYHLKESIVRFGTAIQYETERNEMWNKFFRDVIFHTNRHNPSRDIANKFADEVILRHVAMGGSWNNGESFAGLAVNNYFNGENGNNSIQAFYFSATREFTDNNYIQAYQKLTVGTCGVFQITEAGNTARRILVSENHLAPENPGRRSIWQRGSRTAFSDAGNIKVKIDDEEPTHVLPVSNVKLLDLADLYRPLTSTDDTILSINRFKFGTLWWLKTHDLNFDPIPAATNPSSPL